MSKRQTTNLPIAFTSLGIILTAFSDKIVELTSIPFNVVMAIGMILFLIPLYIWIKVWL